jgi:hypothetical protein
MKRQRLVTSLIALGFATSLAIVGCQSPLDAPTTAESIDDSPQFSKVVSRVTGGGHYLFAGVFDIQFSMSAVENENGNVSGSFHQELTLDGLRVEIHGTVTCLTVDAENRRAWIGAVITQNHSEHPDFTTEINQPGRDVWFRVLDGGNNEPDRLTFLGFEGGGGIITSAEYCEGAIWPDDNARRHPVISGQIKVTP